jgi:PTS system nitrogen regulatory IIA component
LANSEGMSYWRWLLFAMMARLEVDEATYLRIPESKAIRCVTEVVPPRQRRPEVIRAAAQARLRWPCTNTSLEESALASCASSGGTDFPAAFDVLLDLSASTPQQALEAIATRMAAVDRAGLGGEMLFRALWRREQAASTAIGHGVALPHARIAGIDRPILLFARTQQPIAFGAADGLRVSLIFAVVIPPSATDDHLRILAAAAERFSDDALRRKLRAAASADEVRRLLGRDVE